MESEQGEARQSPLNTSCPLWSFYRFASVSSMFFIVLVLLLYLAISWLWIERYMLLLCYFANEGLPRWCKQKPEAVDVFHALWLDVLLHVHILVNQGWDGDKWGKGVTVKGDMGWNEADYSIADIMVEKKRFKCFDKVWGFDSMLSCWLGKYQGSNSRLLVF